jgi:hypothetical protein
VPERHEHMAPQVESQFADGVYEVVEVFHRLIYRRP